MCLNIIIPLGSFYYYFWFIFFMWHIHWDRLVWHWSLEFIRVCVNTLRCHPDTRESRGWNRMWYPGALSSRKKKKKSHHPCDHCCAAPHDECGFSRRITNFPHMTMWHTGPGMGKHWKFVARLCCIYSTYSFIKMTNSPKQHQCQTLKAWSQIYNSARAFTHQTRDVHVLFFFSHSVLTFSKGHGRVRSKEEW